MSLNKAIEHGKEKRKPYSKAKMYDKTCRNHGSCPWCSGNRLNKNKKVEEETKDKIKEISDGNV